MENPKHRKRSDVKMRLHVTISRTKMSPGGTHVQALGVKVGYWPCLKAPFVSLCVSNRIIDVWWGLPSYLEHDWAWTWPRCRGCCSHCGGTGASFDAETNGRCWDCHGTGHLHLG